jgi:hypothetical protein
MYVLADTNNASSVTFQTMDELYDWVMTHSGRDLLSSLQALVQHEQSKRGTKEKSAISVITKIESTTTEPVPAQTPVSESNDPPEYYNERLGTKRGLPEAVNQMITHNHSDRWKGNEYLQPDIRAMESCIAPSVEERERLIREFYEGKCVKWELDYATITKRGSKDACHLSYCWKLWLLRRSPRYAKSLFNFTHDTSYVVVNTDDCNEFKDYFELYESLSKAYPRSGYNHAGLAYNILKSKLTPNDANVYTSLCESFIQAYVAGRRSEITETTALQSTDLFDNITAFTDNVLKKYREIHQAVMPELTIKTMSRVLRTLGIQSVRKSAGMFYELTVVPQMSLDAWNEQKYEMFEPLVASTSAAATGTTAGATTPATTAAR